MDPKRVRIAVLAALLAVAVAGGTARADSKVTVGSPTDQYVRNAQNEPALAIDPAHPLVLAAGANESVDSAPCAGSSCNFTRGVGGAGIYFSFDGGGTWTQPEYAGWSARSGLAGVGPIATLPGYYERGLVAGGDPALAFGPRPGASGFAWSNGSRLYYAHLTSSFPGRTSIKGDRAIALSYSDDVHAATSGGADAWSAPIIVTQQNAAMGSDKDAIWVDNAASSPYFGRVYICDVARQAEGVTATRPERLMLATSIDGGDSWTTHQLAQAADHLDVASGDPSDTHVAAGQSGGRQGCAIRSDSKGVVYVFWTGFANRHAVHYLTRSFDGGARFERPRPVAQVVACGAPDPVSGGPTFDGVAGTRGLTLPSVDIANGAPTGAGATDRIFLTWCDAADGLDHEHALVTTSADGGDSWSAPNDATAAGDRPDLPAIAVSPDGTDVYVTYDAFLSPWQADTTSARLVQGVVVHADVTSGAIGAWQVVHRAAAGDARASSRQLNREFIYDYLTAVATDDGAVATWIDARNAADCPAVDAYRQSLTTATPLPPPTPASDCPPSFGNLDIYAGVVSDPTP